MWTRLELKQNARKNLKTTYWTALLVTSISLLLNGGSMFSRRYDRHDFDSMAGASIDWNNLFANFWIQLLLLSIGLAFLVAIFFKIFISTTILVGERRWFSRNRESAAKPTVGQMFSLFRGENWLPTVGAMLWMEIWLWLWSLLPLFPILVGTVAIVVYLVTIQPIMLPPGFDLGSFVSGWEARGWQRGAGSWRWDGNTEPFENFNSQFPTFWADNQNTILLIAAIAGLAIVLSIILAIPVIIKTYAYRMTPWVLADNPRIGFRRALKLSRQMMRGNKFDLFVLDLSFLGWYFLGLLAFVIGTWFVRPYHQATIAELYAILRKNTVNQGLATMEDFGFRAISRPTPAAAAEPVASAVESALPAEPVEPAAPADPSESTASGEPAESAPTDPTSPSED